MMEQMIWVTRIVNGSRQYGRFRPVLINVSRTVALYDEEHLGVDRLGFRMGRFPDLRRWTVVEFATTDGEVSVDYVTESLDTIRQRLGAVGVTVGPAIEATPPEWVDAEVDEARGDHRNGVLMEP
jgi:hypothetical protein